MAPPAEGGTAGHAYSYSHEIPLNAHPFSSTPSSQQPQPPYAGAPPSYRPPQGGLPSLPPTSNLPPIPTYSNNLPSHSLGAASANGAIVERQRGESSPVTSRHLPPSITQNEALFPREGPSNGGTRQKSSSVGPGAVASGSSSRRDETREERRARKERERAARGVVDALDGGADSPTMGSYAPQQPRERRPPSSTRQPSSPHLSRRSPPPPTQPTSPTSSTSVSASASSSKSVLTLALQRAQSAVLLDSANNVPAAIAAYRQSVRLLKEVMERVEENSQKEREREREKERWRGVGGGILVGLEGDGATSEKEEKRRREKREKKERAKEDERRRLLVIHDTYEARITMLLSMPESGPPEEPLPNPTTPPGSATAHSAPVLTPKSIHRRGPSLASLGTTNQSPTSFPSEKDLGGGHYSTASNELAVIGNAMMASPPPSPMDPMIPHVPRSPNLGAAAPKFVAGTVDRLGGPAVSVANSKRSSVASDDTARAAHFRARTVSAEETTSRGMGLGVTARGEDDDPDRTMTQAFGATTTATRDSLANTPATKVDPPPPPPIITTPSTSHHQPNPSLSISPPRRSSSFTKSSRRNPSSSSESSHDSRIPVTAQSYAGWPGADAMAEGSRTSIVRNQSSLDSLNAARLQQRSSGENLKSAQPVHTGSVLDRPRPRPSRNASLASQSGIVVSDDVRFSQFEARQAAAAAAAVAAGAGEGRLLVSSTTSQGTISQRRKSPQSSMDGHYLAEGDEEEDPTVVVHPASASAEGPPFAFGQQYPSPLSTAAAATATAATGSLPFPSGRARTLSQPGKRPSLTSYDTSPSMPTAEVLRLDTSAPTMARSLSGGQQPTFGRKASVPTPTSLAAPPYPLDRKNSTSSQSSVAYSEKDSRGPSPMSSKPSGSETPVSATFGRIPPLPLPPAYTSVPPYFAQHPPNSPPAAIPIAPVRRPFHLMCQIVASIDSGAYVTPRLFVPKLIWSQAGVKLVGIETKVRMLDLLLAGVEGVERTGEWMLLRVGQGRTRSERELAEKSGGLVKELESFEALMEGIQSTLEKKLGFGSVGKKSAGASFSAWSMKLSRSLDRVTSGRSLDSPATYVESIARVFRLAQSFDQHIAYIADSEAAYADLSNAQRDLIEGKFKRTSEFFGQAICGFVLRDLAVLMDKFVKRSGVAFGGE